MTVSNCVISWYCHHAKSALLHGTHISPVINQDLVSFDRFIVHQKLASVVKDVCGQGRLLHGSMDAACVLEKKRGGTNIMHIFVKIGGGKLRGKKDYITSAHICSVFLCFLQNFLARCARSIALYFRLSPIRGRGTYTAGTVVRLTFKVGRKASIFRPALLMTWCHQIDHTKSKHPVVHFLLHWLPATHVGNNIIN